MSIKRTIIATVAVLALVAVVAPVSVSAVTVDELLAQIAQLQSQLQGLQPGGTPVTGTGACAGITFTRNLTVGATGSDVKCLQVILNSSATTQVAITGAGSPGAETTYFGAKTLVAVKKYQVAQGFTPANQVGPLTRAKLNASLGGGGTNPIVTPTGAGLQIMLAYDNPASTTLVSGSSATDGQGGADLAHFTFVNGDNAPVNITHLVLTRIGVSDDALLNNVYLYQGANRLTDGATVSSGLITFNGNPLFTVPAGGSTTIRVVADLYYGKAGQTVAIKLASASNVTTNASSVKGTYPITGNVMMTASGTLATVNFSSTVNPYTGGTTAVAVDPQVDYPVWQGTATVATRAVTLNRFALYQTGSAPTTAIQNYRLFIDGVQIGSAVAQPDANSMITFDLSSSPVTMQTGARTVKVLADIISGSSLTFSYSLRNSTDSLFVDSQISVGITPTVSSTTFTQLRSCNYNTSSYGCTINAGSVTIAKATNSPSGNIVLGAPGADLGDFVLTAAGEPVKITDMYVCISDVTSAPTYLRNGTLYANGVQIGSTTNITSSGTASCTTATAYTAGTHFSLGSSLIVNPGSPVTMSIKADIHETTGSAVASSDSLFAVVTAGSSNATGQVSKNSISTPASGVQGNTLTVATGALTVAKYTAYTDQTLVAGGQNVKMAHFIVSSNTSEAVTINTVAVDLVTITSTHVTNLYATLGTTTLATKPTTTGTGATTSGANSWSTNYVLQPGASTDLIVYGTVDNGYKGGSVAMAAYVTGLSNASNTTVCGGDTNTTGSGCSSETTLDGQTLVFQAGSLTEAANTNTPNAGVLVGGQTVTSAKFDITAAYDNYTISEVAITPATNGDKIIASAQLVDDATGAVLGTQGALSKQTSLTTDYYFTGMNILVPRGTTKTIAVKYVLAVPDSTVSTDELTVKSTLHYLAYQTSGGTLTSILSGAPASTTAGNDLYVFKSVPTVALSALTSSEVNGLPSSSTEIPIYRFTVTAPAAGEVDLKQMKFDIVMTNSSSGAADTMTGFKIYRNGSNVTGVSIRNNTGNTDLTGSTTITDGTTTINVLFTGAYGEGVGAGSTNTYELRATCGGFTTASGSHDSASVKLDTNDTVAATYKYDFGTNATVHYIATTAAGAATASANFIWSDHSASNGHLSDYDSNHTSSGDWANSMSTYIFSTLAQQLLAP